MQETLNRSVRDRRIRIGRADSSSGELADQIERSIAQTLSELDEDAPEQRSPGAMPLDDAPPSVPGFADQPTRDSRQGRCQRRQSEAANRPIVAALIGMAVFSLAALGIAFTHGFIP